MAKVGFGLPLATLLVLGLTGCASAPTGQAPPGTTGSAASAERSPDYPPASDSRLDTPYPATEPRTEPPPIPSPVPCDMANPTVTTALNIGGALPAGASTAPSSALAVMFGSSSVDRNSYFVDLVDATGHVLASVKAHLRSPITGTCGNDVQVYPAMPLISASAGRAYYLDGDTDIRYLAADGSTGLATKVPGSSQSVAMFAVSPDDKKIAVSVFDYRSHPLGARLYVEDLAGGTNHVDLPPSGLSYRWPVGWHAGNLVVGQTMTTSSSFGFYGPLPYRITKFQLLDPATGRVTATLGEAGCTPASSLPTAGGVACETQQGAVGVIDWSGNTTMFASGDDFTGGVSVSPDGIHVAASGQGAILKLISSPATGSTEADIGGGYPEDGGWLDASHVMVRGGASEFIVDIQTRTDAFPPSGTVLAARLPGGY